MATRKELTNGKYIDDQMGNGVPEGGTTGQVLRKSSNADYDVEWGVGIGGGVTNGNIIGTGVATRVAFWSATDTLSSNANLYWDNVNSRLGVGNPSPQVRLHVGNAGGDMGFPYEEAIVEKTGDTKFGAYTSAAAPNLGGASYVLGYTKFKTNLNYHPGFEYQLVGAAIDGDNYIRYNFLQRNTAGTVAASNDDIFKLYADARVSFKKLIGTGTRMVVSDASGFLDSQAIPSAAMTAAVTADIAAGAIDAGTTVASGTTFQQFVDLLLTKIFFPTLNAPSFSLSNNQGNPEIGTTVSVLLTFNFNRGSILGSTSGIWNPSFFQNFRAGASSSYTINGTTQVGNTLTVSRVVAATNSYSGTVTYATGPQPLDSKGNNYSTPLAGATSASQSTSFTGIYPYFYYKSNSPITAANMQSAIASGAATKVVGDSTGTITINFAATGEYLAVAYPATSTTKTVWYVNALDNGSIPGGVFGSAATLACSSSSSFWSSINYKIHVTAGLITQSNPMELRNS